MGISWKTKLLAILLLGGAAATPVLLKQHRWAQKVNAFSGYKELIMPIEAGSLESLLASARDPSSAGQPGAAFKFKPRPTYEKAVLDDGRAVTVRPGYTEKEAPQGAFSSIPTLDLLRAVLEDDRADGFALNPGVAAPPASFVLGRDEVARMISSLKKRGFQESPRNWAAQRPEPVSPAEPAPDAPETPRLPYTQPQPGKWVVKVTDQATPENKIKLVIAVRDITGRGLADSKALVESLPGTVVEGVSRADAVRIRDVLNQAGAMCSIYEAQ